MKKKNKESKQLKKFISYFRELSIVIIGVAVTLYAGNIINGIKEKKDLKLQLNAIYLELEDNAERVRMLNNYYERTEIFRDFLIEDFNNPNQTALNDSILKYSNIIGKIDPFIYKKGAYEMFLYSGAMKSLNNRQLLLEITEAYAMLEILKEDYDRYSDLKTQEIQKMFNLDTKLIIDNIDIKTPQLLSLYNFYMSVSRGMYAKEVQEKIESLLSNRPKIK